MHKFKAVAAQGEITIRRIAKIPAGCTAMKAEAGKFIIGHSETGHHHVIAAAGANVSVLDKPPEGMRILYAVVEKAVALNHLRDHDTHESIQLDPGTYEFRVAREFDHYAELARQSAD